MAATGTVHGTHISKQYGTTAADRVDFVTDTLKVMLVTNVTAPDPDAHDYISDLEANEIANGNGYTTGGVALGGKSITLTGASNKVVFDATDPSWTFTASKTFRYAILYKVAGGASSADVILCSIDFGADQTTSTVFTIQLDTDGIMKAVY
jgi:hypothetical protein